MKIAGIIPARYASSRFPGKPLADILGKPMIQHVYEQSLKCALLDDLYVATDDSRIFDCVIGFGGKALMTAESHTTGTERCHEVASSLDSSFGVVINIQGDEPYIHPGQIEQLASAFLQDDIQIATLVKKIRTRDELFNPNVVKVMTDHSGRAICFSRSPIPFCRGKEEADWLENTIYFKHIGIYGYRTDVLRKIVSLPVAPPEKAESLEQMRWIWNGYSIMTRETEYESIAIDTPADLLLITNNS